MIHYAFTENNMFNCSSIRPVKWYNRLIGFPGERVIARCSIDAKQFDADSLKLARVEFNELGLRTQILGFYD